MKKIPFLWLLTSLFIAVSIPIDARSERRSVMFNNNYQLVEGNDNLV